MSRSIPLALAAALFATAVQAAPLPALKKQAIAGVEARAKLAQEMNDSIFSFGELGFQEVETSRYVTEILEKNGFTVTRGVSGLPTGWVATWTNGKAVLRSTDQPASPRRTRPHHDHR